MHGHEAIVTSQEAITRLDPRSQRAWPATESQNIRAAGSVLA